LTNGGYPAGLRGNEIPLAVEVFLQEQAMLGEMVTLKCGAALLP
jgi:hypothetical protein